MLRSLFPSANTSTSVEDSLVTLQVGKRVFPNVSPSLRRELWLSVLRKSRAASRAAAAYPSLLLSALPSDEGEEAGGGKGGTVPLEVREAISRDVGRTFPSVAGFEPEDASSKQQLGSRARSLARVLTAYAAFDPAVSYCQGMNFLGGLLLLYLDSGAGAGAGDGRARGNRRKHGSRKKKKDARKRSEGDVEGGEEVSSDPGSDGGFDETLAGDDSAERAAFGLLTYLLMSKGLRALYAEGMQALTARLSHLHALLPPEIRQLLDDDLGGVSVTLFAAPWFMTAFASDFPVSVSARLVDAMLTTPPAVDRPLLRLAAACVRACRGELLSARDAEAAVRVLRKTLPSRKVSRLHDLVSQAFEREWSAEELAVLSSEHPRLTTEEQQQGCSSSSSSSAAAAPSLPFEPQDAAAAAIEESSSSRGSSPTAAAAAAAAAGKQHQQQQQHRKLKWEDALLARRAASADREAGAEEPRGAGAGGAGERGEGGGSSRGGEPLQLQLQLPLPPPPAPVSARQRAAAPEAGSPSSASTSAAAAEALSELLSCRLELDSSPLSSAPPSPSPAAATAAAAATQPPLSSDSLWTSFRRAEAEEEPGKEDQADSAVSAAAAAAAAARERAASDLEGWSSFQRSASMTREEEKERDADERK